MIVCVDDRLLPGVAPPRPDIDPAASAQAGGPSAVAARIAREFVDNVHPVSFGAAGHVSSRSAGHVSIKKARRLQTERCIAAGLVDRSVRPSPICLPFTTVKSVLYWDF